MRKLFNSFIGFLAGIAVIVLLWENTASGAEICWIAGSIVSYMTYTTLNYIRRHEAR